MPDHTLDRLRLSIASEAADDLPTRLNRFAEVCRNRRGVRVVRRGAGFDLSVDMARIEAVGPVIEAAASELQSAIIFGSRP